MRGTPSGAVIDDTRVLPAGALIRTAAAAPGASIVVGYAIGRAQGNNRRVTSPPSRRRRLCGGPIECIRARPLTGPLTAQ